MDNINLDEYCLITHTPNTLFPTALPLVATAQNLLSCKSKFQPEHIHTQATPSLDLLFIIVNCSYNMIIYVLILIKHQHIFVNT